MSELRFQRLSELRQQASDELGQPIDSDDVVLLAAHRLSRDSLLAKLTEGSGDPERLSRENAYNPAWRVMSSSTSSVWVTPESGHRGARSARASYCPFYFDRLCQPDARFFNLHSTYWRQTFSNLLGLRTAAQQRTGTK
jgi:hypothetical protein